MGAPHLVPLPRQAVAVFRELHELTGRGKLMFRGERHHDRPMSNNTINAGFRAMGFAADEVVMHGYRATARTMLHERLGFSPDVIEAQLAHSVRDNLGAGVQPDGVHRAAAGDVAAVGGLSGRVAPGGGSCDARTDRADCKTRNVDLSPINRHFLASCRLCVHVSRIGRFLASQSTNGV
jgi:hypothetical protein